MYAHKWKADPEEDLEKKTQRRQKKARPSMRVSGRGMKRFAKPPTKKD